MWRKGYKFGGKLPAVNPSQTQVILEIPRRLSVWRLVTFKRNCDSVHDPRDEVPPHIVHFSHWRAEFAGTGLDDKFVAAHFADLNCRNAHQLRALDHLHRVKGLAGDDDARLRFAKEQGVQPCRTGVPPVSIFIFSLRQAGSLSYDGQIQRRANQPRCLARNKLADAAFGQAYRQAALAAIVRAFYHAALDESEQCGVKRLRGSQITAR